MEGTLNTQNSSKNFEALRKGMHGGTSGALAMGLQVGTFMWMRTIMNYQTSYGTNVKETVATLYNKGGVKRFYRGFIPSLIQGVLSKFGDTAANTGILALFESHDIPVYIQTGAGSIAAGFWRIAIMPIDSIKTMLQVGNLKDERCSNTSIIKQSINKEGYLILYQGSSVSAIASIAGHYPWFLTFNYLQKVLPSAQNSMQKHVRHGCIGFAASLVSDVVSNSFRVVKIIRQTSSISDRYLDNINHIVRKDGVMGLFIRGLKVRILTNCLQGLMFSVLWNHIHEIM